MKERLSEESEKIRLAKLCELEENRITSLLQLELEQRRRKAFVDRHRRGNEKEFEIGKPVLLFQTRMGNMPGKLRFRESLPFYSFPFRQGCDLLNVGHLGHDHIDCQLLFICFDQALVTVMPLLSTIVTIDFVVVT